MNFLQRLFSQPKVEAGLENSTQIDEKMGLDQNSQAANLNCLPPGLHLGMLSDIGRERERNEDALYVFESLIQHNYGQEPFGLFIVADGMGGHQKGEIASLLAIRTTANHILKDIYLPYLANDNQSSANRTINESLIGAIERANSLVHETVPDSGTTLTAALIMGNNAYIVHVGDTRVYLFSQNELKQITEDHSLARHLEKSGQISPTEAAQVQNVLYRAIGQSDTIEADIYVQHLSAGSSLLLCSDGLWGLVDNETLKEILSMSATPQQACEQLVAMANQNGGRDNITVIIITKGVNS